MSKFNSENHLYSLDFKNFSLPHLSQIIYQNFLKIQTIHDSCCFFPITLSETPQNRLKFPFLHFNSYHLFPKYYFIHASNSHKSLVPMPFFPYIFTSLVNTLLRTVMSPEFTVWLNLATKMPFQTINICQFANHVSKFLNNY